MLQANRYSSCVCALFFWVGVLSVFSLSGCGTMTLNRAMINGDMDQAHQFIVKNQELDTPDERGIRPLHIAADLGQHELFDELIAHGVTIDPKTNDGWTPLMFAVQKGYMTMVETLVEKGGDVNAANKAGGTPVMIAAFNGQELAFDYLIAKNGSIEAKTNIGITPLMMACEKGHLSIAKKLLDLGDDVNAASDQGWTPLMYAVQNGKDDLVQLVIDKGADIHARNNGGGTPLFIAVFHDNTALATELIALGAEPVKLEKTEEDSYTTAKLSKLMAEIQEKQGNKPEAAEQYRTAAAFFTKAEAGFKEKAAEMSSNFWRATIANALAAGIAAGGAAYQAQQTGFGMQQYQQAGTGGFQVLEKQFLAKSEQCHALAAECNSRGEKLGR